MPGNFDTIVVGSGPNGLAAAIAMQQAGLAVLLIEGRDEVGGGLRSAEITLPGFIHDVCSAIHPMAAGSPFFRTLPLQEHGLTFIYPEIEAAHPLDDGDAAVLYRSIERTAMELEKDERAYKKLLQPLVKMWPRISAGALGPLRFPKHPLLMAQFGLKGFASASRIAKKFQSEKARGLWAGMAAHSTLSFEKAATAAVPLVLMSIGHLQGWPLAKGGSISIARALSSYFVSRGGTIQTNFYVQSLRELPPSRAVILDVSPKQLLRIAGDKFSSGYKNQLQRFRYGPGVFKIDWALDSPAPFLAPSCLQAATIHIGNTWEEISASEKLVSEGKHPEKPFVLFVQQSLFDPSRAPAGKHTAWAYCHVPNGSAFNMTDRIESQVERFAPGFRERILQRHTMNALQMEEYDPNYVGGDINTGAMDIQQLFTRPALRLSPYNTSANGIYICSSATPPGGGVHGMCGYYAAKKALKEIFRKNLPPLDQL